MTDPFRKPLRIYDTPANNVKLNQKPIMNAPTQETASASVQTSAPPAQTQVRNDKLQALAEYAMTPPQEKAPAAADLTQIAAEILNGLLASGDFTQVKSTRKATGYPGEHALVRPEAVNTAVELAKVLFSVTENKLTPIGAGDA